MEKPPATARKFCWVLDSTNANKNPARALHEISSEFVNLRRSLASMQFRQRETRGKWRGPYYYLPVPDEWSSYIHPLPLFIHLSIDHPCGPVHTESEWEVGQSPPFHSQRLWKRKWLAQPNLQAVIEASVNSIHSITKVTSPKQLVTWPPKGDWIMEKNNFHTWANLTVE